MSVRAQVSGARTSNKQMEEEDLIDAEEIRALVRGLAMQRQDVFRGNLHLYFQRTLPSFVSSTMIPESASCRRISSLRLKSRRFFAAFSSSTSASTCSEEMRGLSGPKPSFASFSSSSCASTA